MKNAGNSFDLEDKALIKSIRAPKELVTVPPVDIVYTSSAERWVIVTLKWDGKPRLGIRWFWGTNGYPTVFGNAAWFVLPPNIAGSVLNGLPLEMPLKKRGENFLASK
jgi:hypothetical protein